MNGADLAQQLKAVRDYLDDLIADLETPIPPDAPAACQAGEHLEAAELPGVCVVCGTEIADGRLADRTEPLGAQAPDSPGR